MPHGPVEICRQARSRGLAAQWDQAPELGLILVTGPDCREFLHARLTSDVLSLEPGEGQLSAKLTGRGELVAYFSLHRMPDLGQPFPSFLFLISRRDLDGLLADLEATLISENALLEDVSDQFEALLIQGPEAPSFLGDFFNLSSPDRAHDFSVRLPEVTGPEIPAGLMVFSRSFTGDPGRLLLWPTESAGGQFEKAFWSAARTEGLAILGPAADDATAWNWLTIEAGWPILGRDLAPSRVVLPGTGLEQQVVSATKGCFPGQEVVARIRTYGSVPKAMRGLVLALPDLGSLPGLPEPGSPLIQGGNKIGFWGAFAWSVTRDSWVALAFLDRTHRAPGTGLELTGDFGSMTAEVVLLPFFRAADDPERARHLHDQAIRLFSANQDEEALALLEESIRLDPGFADAYEALGVILGRTERYLQAIDIFRRLEEVAPGEPMVHTNLSLFYMKIGDKDEAERQKAQATLKRFAGTSDPAEARALEESAEASRRQEAGRKIDMFAEVLQFDPADPLALMGMGRAWSDLGDHGRAVDYLAQALDVQPDNSSLYASYGKALQALGRSGEAADIFRQGVAVAGRRGDLMPLKDMEHRLLLMVDN